MVDFLEFRLALNALFFQIGDPRLEGVAFERELACTSVSGANFIRAAQQVLARLAQKLFVRRGPCLNASKRMR